MSKEPPVGAFFKQRQEENIFSASRLPADNCRMGALGQKMINKQLRRTIFEVQLGIHDDVHIDVQSAGRLCRLSQLDGHSFARILYAAPTAMKQVIISCPEVKPQSELEVKNSPRETSVRPRSFATTATSAWRLPPGANNFLASSHI